MYPSSTLRYHLVRDREHLFGGDRRGAGMLDAIPLNQEHDIVKAKLKVPPPI